MITKSILGVEIFSEGTWNGDTYTVKDLESMVSAFNQTSKNCPAPLKLGHNEQQNLLNKDGLPAAGWVDRIYILGSKLLADFKNIPEKIYELIQSGAYRKVSSEIYWDAEVNGEKYPRMLAAVSLLGADLPAVTNLSDILSLYYRLGNTKLKCYDYGNSNFIVKKDDSDKNTKQVKIKEIRKMEKTESEIRLELELTAVKEKYASLNQKTESMIEKDKSKDLELKKYIDEKAISDKAIQDLNSQLTASVLSTQIAQLQSERLVSPSMLPYVKELLGEDRKEYTLDLNGAKKTLSKFDLVKEILKLYASNSQVNLVENSQDTKVENTKDQSVINQKIEQYAKDNKVTYGQAYSAIHRQLKLA